MERQQAKLRQGLEASQNISMRSRLMPLETIPCLNTKRLYILGRLCLGITLLLNEQKVNASARTQKTHYLFSLPFCSKECLSALERSVHTYVFLRVMALAGTLFWRVEREIKTQTDEQDICCIHIFVTYNLYHKPYHICN